jgi:hypothetical protein
MKKLTLPTTACDSLVFEIDECSDVDISFYRDKKNFLCNGWLKQKRISRLIEYLFKAVPDSEKQTLLKKLQGEK